MRLIDLTFNPANSGVDDKKVTINPENISYIVDYTNSTKVVMKCRNIFHVVERKEEIKTLIYESELL